MSATEARPGADWKPAAQRLLLLSYGAFACATGVLIFALPEPAALIEAGASSEFVGHLNQSRAASVVGLGVWSLMALRPGAASRGCLAAFALSSLLIAVVCGVTQFTPAAQPWRWLLVAACLAWAIGFAWVAPVAGSTAGAGRIRVGATWIALASYALFTGLTGLAWLVAPGLMGATFLSVGGAATPYVGLVRGAVDAPLAWAAWTHRTAAGAGRQAALAALATANLLLATTGLLAQLHAIATPSRWVIEALHVLWTVVLGIALVRTFRKPI